jgi:hypothetical protein
LTALFEVLDLGTHNHNRDLFKEIMTKPLHENEHGLSHILTALLIVIVVAAVTVVGWRVFYKKDSASISSCMDTYHDKTLCNFAAANPNLAKLSYTAVDSSVNTTGQTTQITVKNDGHGNMSTFTKNGNQNYNTVTMGNTVYIQNGSNWIKYAAHAPAVDNPATDLKAYFSTSSTPASQRIKYKNLGKDTCSQSSCVKYQVFNPAWAGTNYIWINPHTNRLVRWQGKNNNGVNNLVITYEPVTITAPSPVESASSAASSQAQVEQQYIQQAQSE